MARLTGTISADADEIVALLDEAAELASSRNVPDDLWDTLLRFAQREAPACRLGEARLEDGHIVVDVHPSPEFVNAVQRLRECEPA